MHTVQHDGTVDHTTADVRAAGEVVHDLQQNLFEYRAQTACTGAAQHRLLGHCLQRVLAELQIDPVEVEHAMELLASGRAIGYLLKSRVTDVAEFVDSLQRIANGGSVIDPALIQELVSGRRRTDPLAALSPREHEVLALMAEGRSNAGIARQLWLTEGTVEKHVRSILSKLNLPEAADDHRRVRAVITFLESR